MNACCDPISGIWGIFICVEKILKDILLQIPALKLIIGMALKSFFLCLVLIGQDEKSLLIACNQDKLGPTR